MSETTALKATAASPLDRIIEYVPQGEKELIKLSGAMVRQFLVKPTKSGAMPSEVDVTKFVMLCKARELNPWVGDAFLVGYDGREGPEFSLITSVHALHKRADGCPEYDGMSAGVVVKVGNEVREISGTCYPDGANLIGGWACVKRKDRSEPFYYSVRLQARDKGRSTWNDDKAGMIRKCAIAGALREAFPNQTSGLYVSDELQAMAAPAREVESQGKLIDAARKAREDLHRMADRVVSPPSQQDQPFYEAGHPGDDIATDAGKQIGEQTVPPTLADDSPPDLLADALTRLSRCKTQEEVHRLVTDEAENNGVDILEAATKRLQELSCKGKSKQQSLVK